MTTEAQARTPFQACGIVASTTRAVVVVAAAEAAAEEEEAAQPPVRLRASYKKTKTKENKNRVVEWSQSEIIADLNCFGVSPAFLDFVLTNS